MQHFGILFKKPNNSQSLNGNYQRSEAGREDVEKQEEKFNDLVSRSNTVLFKAKTGRWFDIFPDEVIIDLTKVNIIFRVFFSFSRTQSVFIKNISDVLLDQGFYLATLKIIDQGYVDNTVDIPGLRKHDAVRARKIIQGLVVAAKNDINLAQIDNDTKTLVRKIEELGRTHQGEEPHLE